MDKETYLCKECKHCFVKISDAILYAFDRNNKYRYTCRKSFTPTTVEVDPVVGSETKKGRYDSCSVSRIGKSGPDNCGENAYFWEPKHKEDLFKFIKKEAV
jgi:coenzyme F420-reducing hydrogenase beta subunit